MEHHVQSRSLRPRFKMRSVYGQQISLIVHWLLIAVDEWPLWLIHFSSCFFQSPFPSTVRLYLSNLIQLVLPFPSLSHAPSHDQDAAGRSYFQLEDLGSIFPTPRAHRFPHHLDRDVPPLCQNFDIGIYRSHVIHFFFLSSDFRPQVPASPKTTTPTEPS